MPRLLVLCEYPTMLGGERSMLATLPAIAAARIDVVVAAPADGPLATTLAQQGVAHTVWTTHDPTGIRLPLEQLRSDLAEIAAKVQPGLIHANSLSTARIAGPIAADLGIRSIGHLRDILNLTSQTVADLNRHSRLLAVSHATRDFHVARGLDGDKCAVLNNGVDLNAFRPQSPTGYLHRELNLPASARLLAVVGQLGLRKGTDVALAAALEVADRAAGCPLAHRRRTNIRQTRIARVRSRPPLDRQ